MKDVNVKSQSPQVTLDIDEYNRLTKEIEDLKSYIHQAEIEGKIKVLPVHHYSIKKERHSIAYGRSNYGFGHNINFQELELYSDTEYKRLVKESFTKAVKHCRDQVKENAELEEDLNKKEIEVENLKMVIDKYKKMSFIGRLFFKGE